MEQLGPTLLQSFSPSRSPFYTTAVIAGLVLWATYKQSYGYLCDGLAIAVLAICVGGVMFVKTNVSVREFNYVIVYARSAGLAGALIASGILVYSISDDDCGPKKLPNIYFIHMEWIILLTFVFAMIALFFVTSKRSIRSKDIVDLDEKDQRNNIVQAILMQSTLMVLTFRIVAMSDKFTFLSSDWISNISNVFASGLLAILRAPICLVMAVIDNRVRLTQTEMCSAAIILTIVNLLFTIILIAKNVRLGLARPYSEIEKI